MKTKETCCCPICAESLMVRGLRLRALVDAAGSKMKLIIRRLYCPNCKRLHHELPDCIVPFKRHCAETIEEIISGKSEGVPCDYRTIWRIAAWWKEALPYFMGILKSLAEKYKTSFHEPPAFREITRAAANSNNWIFTGSICTRSV